MTRSSGILMPISSLPSPYGIGTLGKAAYDFADFLAAAGQKYWQVLPLGPTGYGDSPYQCISTFAGNPYFIDLDLLAEDGLLTKAEIEGCEWGTNPRYVDYGKQYESRYKMLRLARERGREKYRSEIDTFFEENKGWLSGYAGYMARKAVNGMACWTDWTVSDEEIFKDPDLSEKYKDTEELYIFIQYLFFKQWTALKKYVNDLGIKFFGDLPIYVSIDSSDVWSEPKNFKLDSDNRPIEVSGVPPDYFSEDGQLWGNPLYDYDTMQKDGWGWWIRRVDGAQKLFDTIRIDHFRGFASYWAVPAGETTAKKGRWVKGPGMKLFKPLMDWFYNVEFIAEDLGVLTEDVRELLEESGLPGMKVLEFAFTPEVESDYLPHNIIPNSVCYTGTHDNAPIMDWWESIEEEERDCAAGYLGLNEAEGIHLGLIRGGMASPARIFVAQMQDWLGLGKYNRTNTPGEPAGNWQWRMLPGEADEALAEKILDMTKRFYRFDEEK